MSFCCIVDTECYPSEYSFFKNIIEISECLQNQVSNQDLFSLKSNATVTSEREYESIDGKDENIYSDITEKEAGAEYAYAMDEGCQK